MSEELLKSEQALEHKQVMWRIRIYAFIAYGIFAVIMLITRGIWGLVGLTCSALVVMINFLWLERIVVKTFEPAPRVSAWRMAFGTMARFTLFGVALSITILVARFDAISVLLGFSIIVAGIMGEALFETIRALNQDRAATRAGK